MSRHDPIDQYLLKLSALLKVRLWAHPGCRRRILEDAHDHLTDAASHYETPTRSRIDAEQLAVGRFGTPEALARQFVGEVRAARRIMLARVGPWMLVTAAGGLVAFTFVARDERVAISPFTADCGSDDRANITNGRRGGRLEGQRVVVAGVWTAKERERFAKVLERFNKQTGAGASVAYENQTRNIAPKLEVRLNSGCPPDVALLPQPGLLRKLARAGQLKPIEDVAGDLVDRNYAPQWRHLGSLGQTLFGVWFKAANKSTVWYRPAIFRAARTTPPKSWKQLKRVAVRLSDANVVPFSVAGADGWTLTDWFENVYLRTAGPTRYEQLAEHQIPWTHPSVKRALRRLAEILGKQEWLAGGVDGMLSTDFEASVQQVFSDQAQAAMVYEGDFVASEIASRGDGKNAQFFDFPSVDGSKPAIVAGGDVAVLFTDNPAARALIRFLATPQAAEPWAKAGGFVSPNNKLADDAYPDTTTRRSARALVSATTISFDLSDQQPPAFGATEGQGMWQIFQDYARNPADIDSVTRRLESAAAAADTCERELPQC